MSKIESKFSFGHARIPSDISYRSKRGWDRITGVEGDAVLTWVRDLMA